MTKPPNRALMACLLALIVLGAALSTGCGATRFHQREKLNDRAMRFDADDNMVYIRNKAEAAREGGFGGFGAAAAGGCGCQ